MTGSGIEVVEDVPPFYEQMLEIVGSNQAVHPDYVSDSLAPMDTLKWSRKKNEKGGDEMTRPAGPIPIKTQ